MARAVPPAGRPAAVTAGRYPDPVVEPWPGPVRLTVFGALFLAGGIVVEILGTWMWRLFA